MITVTPTQSEIQVALRAFLLDVLPANTPVIEGQDNRTPEPAEPDFVTMTILRRPRLSTNIDTPVDVTFVASVAGSVMTVTTLELGTIEVGARVFGTGLVAGTTTVLGQISGSAGGTGTYTIGPGQTAALQAMAAGRMQVMQPTEVVFQLDVHGPASHDNAQIISTLFRDQYGVSFFADQNAQIAPLYADDPRQVPFTNAEQQYEFDYIVEAHLQVNQTVLGIPQQFADAIELVLVDVEATFPP